jgi:hypothetical protein
MDFLIVFPDLVLGSAFTRAANLKEAIGLENLTLSFGLSSIFNFKICQNIKSTSEK